MPASDIVGVAIIVRIAHDGVGVRDIKIGADKNHPERRMEMVEKDGSGLRLSPAGRIAKG